MQSYCLYPARWRALVLSGLLGAALPSTLVGQNDVPSGGDPNQGSTPSDESSKSTDDAREQLTAADVLRALRRQRPENKIIGPSGRGPNWDAAPKDALFPEGFALVNQSGRLSQEGEWWVFDFAKESGISPMKLLPNANVEPMIRSVALSSEAYTFDVSGETTVFERENYFLLHLALRSTAEPAPSPGSENGKPDTLRAAPTENVKKPQEDRPAPTPAGDVDDVVAALEAQKPSSDPITFTATSSALEPVDAAPSRPTLLPEGTAIIDRPARLLQRGRWWTLVFESDSDSNPEPPIKVLPNSNLQTMMAAAQAEPNGLVFVVSGQVTIYDGENYLLTRAVRRRMTGGNLRK